MRVNKHIFRAMQSRLLAGGIACVALVTAAEVAAQQFTDWSAPVSAESLPGSSTEVNTSANDGCPIISPDGEFLYMASNRPGGQGGLDIWRAPRSGQGWGAPENLGPSINTAADEFCPSPAPDGVLFFVRRLSATNTDIFLTRSSRAGGWTRPQRLPTGASAINSPWEEWSPSYFETSDGKRVLYFSSTRNGHPAQDVFYSVDFGPAQFASGGVNSSYSDARPNVRHDGLEIVWDSTRPGSQGTDIWTASRSSVEDQWGPAEQLGNGINTAGNESRASMSWSGTTLVFGSNRPGEGFSDIYVSKRQKVTTNR